MKIFLICPVRGIPDEEKDKMKKFVEWLESKGHKVHWPTRDTNQNDPVGLRICLNNGGKIKEADIILIWPKGKRKGRPLKLCLSQGSLFDFGMAFMAKLFLPEKIIMPLNPDLIKPTFADKNKTRLQKSFNNVLLAMHGEKNERKIS